MEADQDCLKEFQTRIQNLRTESVRELSKLRWNFSFTDDELFDKAVSVHQSGMSRRGRILEEIIEGLLRQRGVPFLTQVSDQSGIISPKKRGFVHDIIIDANLGDKLEDKIIVSCKTSIRERYKQDKNLKCKKLYLVTMEKVKDREKYISNGITIVTVGTGELESMLSSF